MAEYTKKAFQVFCKRVLAAQLIEVLARPSPQEIPDDESDNYLENDEVSNDTPNERKNQGEEGEGKNTNFKFTRQMISQLK